jgi:hypothetical protein
MAKSKKSAPPPAVRVYTLEALLLSGPLSRAFARKNPVVSRTVRVRGDQTLEDLHRALFEAFGRTEEQMYEFHFGKGLLDPAGRRYVLPGASGMVPDGGTPPAGRVTETTLDSLGLEPGRTFAYWFDFAADWWHQVTVRAVDGTVPRGKFPKVTKRVGEDPPQQAGEGYAEEEGPQAITGDAAADMSCLIGEMHLSKGDYRKAIEAFSRAIDSRPTADAYQGRARAYRGLAAADERRAQELG